MCSKNMQQIYKRTPMPKCDVNKVPEFSPANLLHIFRAPFYKNTYGGMLLDTAIV